MVIKTQPKLLTAFSEYGIDFLQWAHEGDYSQYTVCRGTKGNEFSTVTTITNGNYYVDVDVIPGTTYDYQIVAFDEIRGETLVSNMVSLLTSEEASGDIEVPESIVQALIELEADCDELDIIYSGDDWAESVTQDVFLSSVGNNGRSITWSTKNENIVTSNGIVTRSLSGDCGTTLTATLQNSSYMLEGEGVSDLKLQIFKGIHIIPGVGIPSATLVETLETGANGIYHTSALDAGNYTVVVTDNREDIETTERYYKSMFVIKILGNTDILSQNGSVSRGLKNNQLRIVLTWGSTPRDLDSHLSISLDNGSNGHVYYANKSYKINSTEIANSGATVSVS